ncbi:MAG: glycerol kinase [Ilumatobacter sp.]|nr:glycerol kinase [Ilumatobacter sp.]
MTAILVIDVGTTGLRAAVVDESLTISAYEYRPCPPSSPSPGLVEFDATAMAAAALDAARTAAADVPIDAVGITTQRASVVVWDRDTGIPIGPGLGWQDLRTVMECIMAKAEHGWAMAPNQSATKLAWLLANTEGARERDLCCGTVDSWIAWTLTGGAVHVSDQTNSSAAATGLRAPDGSAWRDDILDAFGIPSAMLPEVVDSVGVCGTATALTGSPPIASLIGDQQASLVGQGCIRPGHAKITFGTGGMLDVCTDAGTPDAAERHSNGTYPLPVWSIDGRISWGVEGIMLSAGTNVEWLRDDLGLIETSEQSHDIAARCADTDGVVYVPALLGLGTPAWDYGARGTLLGLTRGTQRPHVVRAVLEGVAQRGADLVDAAVADTAMPIDTIRIDGGMSRNPTFVRALADATDRPIEVAPVVEATTLGAAFLAGLGVGVWTDLADIDDLWSPAHVVEPTVGGDHAARRLTWADALQRAGGWLPDLSALDF